MALFRAHESLSIKLTKVIEEIIKNNINEICFLIFDDSYPEKPPKYFLEFVEKYSKYIKYKINNYNFGELKNLRDLLHYCHTDYFTWLEDDDNPSLSFYQNAIEILENRKNISIVAPITERYLDNKFWYQYIPIDTTKKSKKDRIMILLEYCLRAPNAFESVCDRGVFRQKLISKKFELKYSKSIPVFLFIMALEGDIYTTNDILRKNTSYENLNKYKEKNHMVIPWFLKIFGRKYYIYGFLRIRLIYNILKSSVSNRIKIKVLKRIIFNKLNNKINVLDPYCPPP